MFFKGSTRKMVLLTLLYLGVPRAWGQAQEDFSLDTYIQKIGGKEAWAAIKSFKMEMIGEFGDQMSVSEHYMLKPHCYKIVFSLSTGKEILAYDGKKGQIARGGGVEKMPPGMQYEMQEEADFFDELIFHKKRGHILERHKDTLINNQNYARFCLNKSEWDRQLYFINKRTALLEMVEEYSAEEQYKGVRFKTVFSEYQQVGKVLLPKKMVLFGNDRLLVSLEITKVVWNPELQVEDFRLNRY